MLRYRVLAGVFTVLFGLLTATVTAQPTIAWHPISSTGPFTIEGHTITIPAGGPGIEVMLEIMVSGWGDAPGNPALGHGYNAALNTPCLSSGSGPPLAIKGLPNWWELGIYYDDANHSELICRWCDYMLGFMGWRCAGWFVDHAFWGCPLFPWEEEIIDEGVLYYGGTLILEIPAGADGTYTIEFDPSPTETLLKDTDGVDIPGVALVPGLINVVNDCNDNGVSDLEDIAEGTSQDCNGNLVPDECEAMNRYFSFAPPDAGSLAFRVEMTASTYFPDSLGVLGWVGAPDSNDVSRVVATPFFDDSWPALVNVADCEIVPVANYEIRPTPDGSSFGDPILTATIAEPSPKKWADVVGSFNGVAWSGPDGTVNMDDLMAGVQTFQQLAGAPHWMWIDLDEEVPNAVINFADIQRLVQGFKGEPYPFSDPANCP